MPATSGEQAVIWLTVVSLGLAILHQLAKLTKPVIAAVRRLIKLLDWTMPITDAYPDAADVVRKLKKMNGDDQERKVKTTAK